MCDLRFAIWDRRRGPAGVTLLELLVVIVIISMLLGFAITFFASANRDLGLKSSANHCVALVRSVSEHARATRSPAWLVVNTGDQSIHTLTESVIQAWNFEDLQGAFGQTANATNARTVPGREGLAFSLNGSGTITCAEIPVYAEGQGIGVEAWIHLSPARRGRQVVCSAGPRLELAVEGDRRVSARLGEITLMSSGNERLPVDRWVQLKVASNGSEARLYANGEELESRRGDVAWTKAATFVVGAPKDGLVGLVDSVRVLLVIPREKFHLPAEGRFVELTGGAVVQQEFMISFTPEGRLDPRRHAGEVSFVLQSPTDKKPIRISPLGGVLR